MEAALAAAAVDAVGATPNEPGPSLGIRAAAVIEDPSQKVSLPNIYAVPSLVDPSPMTAELVSFPVAAGVPAQLAWKTVIEVDGAGWYESVINASTGAVLYRRNYYDDSGRGQRLQCQNPNVCSQSIASFTGRELRQQRLGGREHDVGQQRQRVPGPEQLERTRVPTDHPRVS